MITLLTWVVCLLVWWLVWELTIHEQAKTIMKKNKELARMREGYEKYVPITDQKKDLIIKLYKAWVNWEQIWRDTWIDGSAINRALRRWNIR